MPDEPWADYNKKCDGGGIDSDQSGIAIDYKGQIAVWFGRRARAEGPAFVRGRQPIIS